MCNGEAMSSSGEGGAAQHETARVDADTGAELRALTLEVTFLATTWMFCQILLGQLKILAELSTRGKFS